jgi:hypothetical protein
MIWHIFKKDAKLLWWLAAIVAVLRFAELAVVQISGLFPTQRGRNLMMLLALGGLLGVGFAICAVVHQDAIPGVRQDWLVRPIRRRDLLASKLLFVVAMIQFPIFLGDLIQALLTGTSPVASITSALSRSIFLLLLVDIPLLAFASVTRNFLEAVTGGVAIFGIFGTCAMLFLGDPGRRFQPTFGTGVEWVTVSSLALTLSIGSAALLGLQYFQRRTLLARCVTGAVTLLGILATFVPWTPAFAIQKTLSPSPNSAAGVNISFQPSLGRYRRGADFPVLRAGDVQAWVFLPIDFSGLPDDSGVQVDRPSVSVIGPGGGSIAQLVASRISVRRNPGDNPTQSGYQMLAVPGDLYRQIKNQSVRLEIDYSLTLFKSAFSHSLPAVNANVHVPGAGWCATRVNPAETAVQLSCEQGGRPPDCLSINLEHLSSGRKTPDRLNCEQADYGPFPSWQLLPDGLAHFGGALAFRDPNGFATFPVIGSMLPESELVMHVYRAAEHFTRKVVIPEVRLGDWEAGI